MEGPFDVPYISAPEDPPGCDCSRHGGKMMADQFTVPGEGLFDHELPDNRDKWKRYILKSPSTGHKVVGMRATKLAGTIQERAALEAWLQRSAIVGIAKSPDLLALVHGKDVKRDKAELDKLVKQAKEVAGTGRRANLGTAIHGYAEKVDAGRWTLDDVPAEHRADVTAYRQRITSAGLIAVPELIERITYVERYNVGGKFDRIFKLPNGDYVIGDLKTGDSTDFAEQEIGIQLALYQMGVNTSGVWDKQSLTWSQPVKVREDIAVVMHLPVGSGQCQLKYVDLAQGREDAELCWDVIQSRKIKTRFTHFENVEDLPVPGPMTWAERFSRVTSREEASALYREAKDSGLAPAVLNTYATIGKKALKNLEAGS